MQFIVGSSSSSAWSAFLFFTFDDIQSLEITETALFYKTAFEFVRIIPVKIVCCLKYCHQRAEQSPAKEDNKALNLGF